MRGLKRRLLPFLVALLMALSTLPVSASFWDDDDSISALIDDIIGNTLICVIDDPDLDMEVGEIRSVSGDVLGGSGGITYRWSVSNSSVARVSGSGQSATLTALSVGRTSLTLVARDSAGNEDSDTIWVTVDSASSPMDSGNGGDAYADDNMVYCSITPYSLSMKTNETASIQAETSGGSGALSYQWSSSDTFIARVSGSGTTATVTAGSVGMASITLVVSDGRGHEDSDTITVTVTKPDTPVTLSASGSTSASMNVGEEREVSARASGGSGEYDYVWESDGDVSIRSKSGATASVYGAGAGSGSVTLSVFDRGDPLNSASVTWSFTVNGVVTPIEIELSRGTIDIGPSNTASLQASVSGGSGSFSYTWRSDNQAVATVSGSGTSATIYTLKAGKANIYLDVQDRQTGATKTASCYVVVEASSATFNATASCNNGASINMNTVASNIASAFRSNFNQTLNYSASVRFGSPVGNFGALALQDETRVSASTVYTYASFQDMIFIPYGSGTFTTSYSVTDNGATLSGNITITVAGGTRITEVSMSPSSLTMATYSSQYLSLNIYPLSGIANIRWSSSNTSVAVVEGSNNSVTVVSRNAGSATITAVVTDTTGASISRVCPVTVVSSSTYSPSLACTIGSDLISTSASDSIANQFRNLYGVSLPTTAAVTFSSTGSSNGTLRTVNGRAVQANVTYTFADLRAMYFEPISAGTFSIPYRVTYNGNSLSGNIEITVRGSNLSASIDPTSLRLDTYSSHPVYLTIRPNNAYYRISWSTTNSGIASVSGNGTSVTVNTGSVAGSATIEARITDEYGITITKRCTVTVTNTGDSIYNPTLTCTIGNEVHSTSVSDSLSSQFRNVYKVNLPDRATVKFSSTGNTAYGSLRLSNGNAIRANTSYTVTELRNMYFVPNAAGTFSIPYTLTYNGNSLHGSINIVVSATIISSSIAISNAATTFNTLLSTGTTAATLFTNSINSVLGNAWSYLRFTSTSNAVGALYLNSSMAAVDYNNVTATAIPSLYFVPAKTGIFDINFTVYNSSNASVATGTLFITVMSDTAIHFEDVPEGSYYATAVQWAVNKGVTNGFTATIFGPAETCTRGQVATFLWRANGTPEPTIANPFTDVYPESPFYKAILWAYEKGITLGTTATTFEPSGRCTRGHTITFLWRAKQKPDAKGISSIANANPGRYFTSAAAWADTNNILSGVGNGFNGDEACPRSDIVTYIYRAYQ